MKTLFTFLMLIFTFETAVAADSKLKQQGLMIVIGNQFSPDALNSELSPGNIGEHESGLGYLGEYDLPIADLFYGGLRFGNSTSFSKDANGFNESEIQQTTMGVVLRVPIIATKILTVDAVGEAGIMTTGSVKVTEINVETKYSSSSGEYQRVGGSIGLGYDAFYVYAESGVETNKFRGFEKTGTRTGDLPPVDLSGTYTAFGIKFSPSFMAKYIKK